MKTPFSKTYWSHIGVLITGFASGVLAAYYFTLIPFDFPGEVEKAKRLGIISLTTLAGYPETKDVLTYAAVVGLPPVFSVLTWLIWAGRQRRSVLKEIFRASEYAAAPKTTGWVICLLSVCAFYIFMSFNLSFLLRPGYNPVTGAWPFLGEEGVNLAWAGSVLSGGVFGKDFFCFYGPMMVYPLAWAMKAFGDSVLTGRLYTYFLNLLAYGIVIALLYRTLRWKTVFLASGVLYIFIYHPFVHAPNVSHLRVALGFLPLLLAFRYAETGGKYYPLLAGLSMGQGFVFSQEVFLCSALSTTAFFFLYFSGSGGRKGRKTPACAHIAAGFAVSVAPFLFYFYLKDALMPFFYNIYEYPRLIALGFNALPMPAFKEFVLSPWGMAIMYFAPFVYASGAAYLLPLMHLGHMDKKLIFKASLLIFGILLFRSALGRSDPHHILYASQPAFLLVFLMMDDAVTGILKGSPGFRRAGGLTLFASLAAALYLVAAYSDILINNFSAARAFGFSLKEKFSVVEYGIKVKTLKRGNVFFDRKTASSIEKIRGFLDAETAPGDYVYFFPNEAAYYFLFDRKNPTAHAMSYSAVTSEQRRAVARELESKKPAYVVYSTDTWRIDSIGDDIQMPEVVEYLKKRYMPYKDFGDVLIAKRL